MLDANTQGRALRYIGPLILVVSLILAGMTSSVVYAQRPGEDVYLVKDIRPGPEDSWPVGLTEMNGRLFFVTCSMAWDGALVETFEKFPFRNVQNMTFDPDNRNQIHVTTFGAGVFIGPTEPIGD